MAPAVEKVEDKASTEVVADPLRQASVIIEHKIRNLEKRKRKIEIYKESQLKGQALNNDQRNALEKYCEVVTSLELAQDLRKQFEGITVDSVKQTKKLAKKEAAERAAQDVAKLGEILKLQDVMQCMGIEQVRNDFLGARNNAALLTEEELNFLDEIYVKIFPKREDNPGVPFNKLLSAASEHIVAIIDGKPKEVIGTTYKCLREIIHKIYACGYLDTFEGDPALLEGEAGSGDAPKENEIVVTGDNKYAAETA